MKKFIVLMIICFNSLLLGCGNENSSSNFNENPFKEFSNEPVTNENYQNYFVYEYADNAYKFYNEYKKTIEEFKPYSEKTALDKMVYLDEDTATFSDDFTWVVKQGKSEFGYIGQYKEGKPNGVGMIIYITDYALKNEADKTYRLVYFGNFKDGKYNGYGRKYFAPKGRLSDDILAKYAPLTTAGLYKLGNYLTYEGFFEDGKCNGKGIDYDISNFEIKTKPSTNEITTITGNLRVYSGTFSDDEENGNFIVYSENNNNGYLMAEVEMEDGHYNGKGTFYYSNGNVKYEGELKNDNYDGKGKFYNENGQLIYDGEWKKDKYNGEGKLYDDNGNLIYDGQWKNGMKMEG